MGLPVAALVTLGAVNVAQKKEGIGTAWEELTLVPVRGLLLVTKTCQSPVVLDVWLLGMYLLPSLP